MRKSMYNPVNNGLVQSNISTNITGGQLAGSLRPLNFKQMNMAVKQNFDASTGAIDTDDNPKR